MVFSTVIATGGFPVTRVWDVTLVSTLGTSLGAIASVLIMAIVEAVGAKHGSIDVFIYFCFHFFPGNV